MSQNRDDAPRILGNAFLFRLFLIALALPAAFFLIQKMGYAPSVRGGVLIASFNLFLALRSIFEIIFRVNLLMIYPALWNGVRAVLNLALIAFLAGFRPGINGFILCYAFTGILALAGLALFSRRFVRLSFRIDWALIRHLLRESLPLILSSYLTLLYIRVDVFMLSKMKSFTDVGYYSVATRLVESLDIIANSLMISLFPILSRAVREDRREFERLSGKAIKTLLLIGLPLAIGGNFVADDLIRFLFGAEYAPSGPTFRILCWYTFFGFWSIFLVNLLIACRKQVVDTWISLFLLLANVGLNFFLIPRFSYNGAALATVLIEIFGILFMSLYASKTPAIRLSPPWPELWIAVRASGLFLGALFLLKFFFNLPVLLFIIVGALGYALILFGLKVVSFEEVKNYAASWGPFPRKSSHAD